MTKPESKVSINIYGCCVSRDSVAFRQSKYVVPRYVQAISPLTVTSGKPLNLKTEDFSSYENVHNFTKRCICLDANKNAIDYLVGTNADWLLFDVAELRRVVYFWRNAGIMLTKNSKLTRMLSVVELYTNGEIPSEIIPWELSEKELSVAVEMLCDEIFKYFSPQNIILNEFYNVDVYLNSDGELCSFSEDEKALGTAQNKILKVANEVVKSKFKDCHIITMPFNNFADVKQRWGLSTLHYNALYYDYVERCISVIVNAASREEENERLAALYELYNEKMLSCSMWARKNSYRKSKHIAEERLEEAEKRATAAADKVIEAKKENELLELQKSELKENCTLLEEKIRALTEKELLLKKDKAELDEKVAVLSEQIKLKESELQNESELRKQAENKLLVQTELYKQTKNELIKESESRKSADNELYNVRISKSYKVGLLVTFLPRKLRDLIKRRKMQRGEG